MDIKRQVHDDVYEDSRITFDVVDQYLNHLEVRVGQIFDGNTPRKQAGIWFTVFIKGREKSCVLMSPKTFKALSNHIEKRLKQCRSYTGDKG